VLAAKGRDLEVVLDDEGAVEALKREEVVSGTRFVKRGREGPTPKMPIRMKKPSSKKCQSRSKRTWKRTILPVRNGFIACDAGSSVSNPQIAVKSA
jgi:hypothetical protein